MMELRQILQLVYRRLWIFILFAIIAGCISGYYSYYVMKPVYEADTTLFVNNKTYDSEYGIAYDDLLVGAQLVKDYSELIRSRKVTNAVLQELKQKNLTEEAVAGMITVSSKNETRIIEISVKNYDPVLAMKVANSVANEFSKKAVELMHVENVNIVDAAKLPDGPVGPNEMRNIAIAVFAALVLAAGLVFGLEYLDNTIRTTEDVEKRLGLTILGTIPEFKMK